MGKVPSEIAACYIQTAAFPPRSPAMGAGQGIRPAVVRSEMAEQNGLERESQ
jgi:hypothetical protein